jgi:hypothetical protein
MKAQFVGAGSERPCNAVEIKIIPETDVEAELISHIHHCYQNAVVVYGDAKDSKFGATPSIMIVRLCSD